MTIYCYALHFIFMYVLLEEPHCITQNLYLEQRKYHHNSTEYICCKCFF